MSRDGCHPTSTLALRLIPALILPPYLDMHLLLFLLLPLLLLLPLRLIIPLPTQPLHSLDSIHLARRPLRRIGCFLRDSHPCLHRGGRHQTTDWIKQHSRTDSLRRLHHIHKLPRAMPTYPTLHHSWAIILTLNLLPPTLHRSHIQTSYLSHPHPPIAPRRSLLKPRSEKPKGT
jgi:hypothetical protein